MPIKHDIIIAGQIYADTGTLRMSGANSEEGKTIEYICPEWDTLSFDDTTPILGTHTTEKDGFKTVTIESDDLNATNIIESATIFGVKGAIPIKNSQDLIVSGRTVSVAPGYYPNVTSKDIQNGGLTLTSNFETDTGKFTTVTNITEGYLTSTDNKSDEIQLNTAKGKTIYPSTAVQSAIKAGTYALGDINVAAMEYASGSLGGDATNGKATPVIRYDTVEGIKTIQPPGSDYITIGASVRTEPASYTPAYNLLTAGYIGTSLKADAAESIPVEAEEDKVIYIETDDGTTVTPSTEDQTIALTGKLMQGDIVVEKMSEGILSNIFLEDNKDGTVSALMAVTTPGYVDNTQNREAELTLTEATLSWSVGTVSGGCEAEITNVDNIQTVNADYNGDYYTIKATAKGSNGQAGLNVTNFSAGYLKNNPVDNTSYVSVNVKNDDAGKEIHIPKATLSANGATVSVTEAGYIPAGESQTVQSGAYGAKAVATPVASVSATGGNITLQEQSSSGAPTAGYYFKVSGTAKATAVATAEVTSAGYLDTGSKTTSQTETQEATAYYTVATSEKTGITPTNGQQIIEPEEGTLLSKVTIEAIPDNYAEITGYNYDITSAGQHNIRNYNYVTVAEGAVEIDNATIEFDAILNQEVQTGDYGLPYYNIEVQQGSENTTVSATVTQSGYVSASNTPIDQTSLQVTASGQVFQSQITTREETESMIEGASIGYGEEAYISAGYYHNSRVIKNGVESVTRASTEITVVPNDSLDTLTITASNDQNTGYVTRSESANEATTSVILTQNTPSISSSGLITASAKMNEVGGQSVSQSKTLQLTTQGATTIAPSTTSQTAVEAGVYTTGEIKVAAMSTGELKTPYSTIYDSGLIVTSYGVDTAGYLDVSTKTSSKQLTTIKQYEYTPTTYDQSIIKGQWIDSAITIKGDSDLQPDNIKEGITIFGVTGTYAAVQDYKLSGLWTFDEARLIAYAPSEPITQEIDFYIHAGSGSYGSSITAEYNISYGAQLTYDSTLAYSQSTGIHTTQKGWQGQNFSGVPNTIEFTSEQYVSAAFYNWFTSVATQASGVCTLQASGYPASAYVFYYNGASSVSMAEVNPGASDIAVPCDRIYIIGGVQCSLYSGTTTLTPTVTDIGDVKIQEFNIPSTLSDATVYINY